MNNLILIRQHTRKLLQFGIFDCNPDEIVSRIHHTVMIPKLSDLDARFLLSQWRRGSYCSSFSTIQVLQETNQLLLQFGFPIIEEDFLESIMD